MLHESCDHIVQVVQVFQYGLMLSNCVLLIVGEMKNFLIRNANLDVLTT